MLGWFQLVQIGFALLLTLLMFERAYALWWRAPISDAALRWLRTQLPSNPASSLAWARERSDSYAASLVTAALASEESDDRDLDGLLAELGYRATARLGALRVCATLASTLGLLGGILAIQRGFGSGTGLVALKAGLAQQLALSDALFTMALGVGTSAACFHALALFRKTARELITQSTQIAHLLGAAHDPAAARPSLG